MTLRHRLKTKKRKLEGELNEGDSRHSLIESERPAASRSSGHAHTSSSRGEHAESSSHATVTARSKLDTAAESAVSDNLEKREAGSSVYKSLFHRDDAAADKRNQKDLFINVGRFRYGLS